MIDTITAKFGLISNVEQASRLFAQYTAETAVLLWQIPLDFFGNRMDKWDFNHSSGLETGST
jgi:hypothetical protein